MELRNRYAARLVEPIRPGSHVYVIPEGRIAYRPEWWIASVVSVTPDGDLRVRSVRKDLSLGETVQTVTQFAR